MRAVIIAVVILSLICHTEGFNPGHALTKKFVQETATTNTLASESQNTTADTNIVIVQNGICNGDKTVCNCNPGFTTHGDSGQCGYKQVNALYPLLLQMPFGVFSGIGYFMTGHTAWGAGQAVFTWVCILLALIISCCSGDKDMIALLVTPRKDEGLSTAAQFIKYILMLGIFIFKIVSIVQIGMGSIADGNGVALYR